MDSIQKEHPKYQKAFLELETRMIRKCSADWSPKKMGYLTPGSEEYGRTSILPALFDPNPVTYGGAAFGGGVIAGFVLPPAYWRQLFTTTGSQTLLQGCGTAEMIPEDMKVAWIGLAFPNKQQQITEIRFQIGDRKYGRINIEEVHSYNKPALIFEEGFILNEEQAFHLYGYVEEEDYQRIVMLGALYYKIIDKVLTAPGAAM